jgi:hypothetical protein
MERNWTHPPVTARKSGINGCAHPQISDYYWNRLTVSRLEGEESTGNHVVQSLCTKSCAACGKVDTKVLTSEAPTEDDIVSQLNPEAAPRLLSLLKARKANGEHHPNEETQGQATAGGGESVDPSDVRPEQSQQIPIWRGFKIYKVIQKYTEAREKNPAAPCPIGSPSVLLAKLMKEMHAITGEHSPKHLEAALATASARITTDLKEISAFTNLVRNVNAAVVNDAQSALVQFWGLGILPTKESWLTYRTQLSAFIFDWLKVPEETFFPHAIRYHPNSITYLSHGNETVDPGQTQEIDQEVEQGEKRMDAVEKEAELNLPPVGSDGVGIDLSATEDDLLEDDGPQVQPTPINTTHTQALRENLVALAAHAGAQILGRNLEVTKRSAGRSVNYLPPAREEYELDGDGSAAVTAVLVPGTSLCVLNLSYTGLTLRVVQNEGGIALLISPPTSKEGYGKPLTGSGPIPFDTPGS